MGSEIKMSLQEAVDLLNKWKNENRVVHLSLQAGGGTLAKVLGRIDAVTPKGIFLSGTKSDYSLGKHNLAKLPLEGCDFEYSDAKDAPKPLASQLVGYDAFLYIYYFDNSMTLKSGVILAVLPVEEWPQF